MVRWAEWTLDAVLRVDGLALPEKRRQYLNLALLAAPVISLALSNAQRMIQEEMQRASAGFNIPIPAR